MTGAPDNDTTVRLEMECRGCGHDIVALTRGPASSVRCAECGTTNRKHLGNEGTGCPWCVDPERDDVQTFPDYRPESSNGD